MPSIFICYQRLDCEAEARMFAEILREQFGQGAVFLDADDIREGDDYTERLRQALEGCDVLLALIGHHWLKGGEKPDSEAGKKNWVHEEIRLALSLNVKVIPVVKHGVGMPSESQLPRSLERFARTQAFVFRPSHLKDDARRLVQLLGPHLDAFRLRPYSFAHEKAIVAAYTKPGGLDEKYVLQGCPPKWPEVSHRGTSPMGCMVNPVPEGEIGCYRPMDAQVVVNVNVSKRTQDPCAVPPHGPAGSSRGPDLTLLEAGPREKLVFPVGHKLTVGILVSGGIAPGINAVIHGIVSRHELYRDHALKNDKPYTLDILGYSEGFKSLLLPGDNYRHLSLDDVKNAVNEGGSILPTARASELLDKDPERRREAMKKMLERLLNHGIHILYIIGGDGSMRAAHDLGRLAERMKKDIKSAPTIVGVPKTMDNDILWVWQSFGFLSAVDVANKAITHLHQEVRSNPRLGIVQLFGSDSGFVVSHAALASGVCDLALIPEVPFTMKQVSKYLIEKLRQRRYPKPGSSAWGAWGMVVMAETAVPQDAREYLDDEDIELTKDERDAIKAYFADDCRVRGQTPDALRSGGLKIVSKYLQREIRKSAPSRGDDCAYWEQLRVVTNEPRHLLRSTEPKVSDVIFGQRLGTLAVDNAMAGFTRFMVSQWVNEYVLVPLDLVVMGRKRVPENGIFWKSVLARTGQPTSLK